MQKVFAAFPLIALFVAMPAFAATPTVTLTPTPASVVQGSPAMLTWSSTNAVSCTSPDFSTGNAISGSVSVSPTATKTYAVTCTGAAETTWQFLEEDYTDYFCLNPNGLNDPNQNGFNKAYSFIPNCPSGSASGAACTTAGATCKVNSGQCVIHTEIYTCSTGGSGSGSGSTATAYANITVNPSQNPPPQIPPTTPPPGAPSCTISSNPSTINQGQSSTLSWTITNFSSFLATNFPLSGIAEFSASLPNGGSWSGFNQSMEHVYDLAPGQYFSGLGFRSNCDFYSSEDACLSPKVDSLASSALAYQGNGGSWSGYEHDATWELSPGQYFSGLKLRPDCDFYSSDDSCVAVKIATASSGSSAYRSNSGGSWSAYERDYTWTLSQGQYISGIRYKTNCDNYSSADGCISLKISGGNSISGTSVVSPLVTTSYTINVTGNGTSQCSTIVTVRPPVTPPPTCHLTAPQTSFEGWGVADVSWTTTGSPTTITFNHGIGSFPVSLGHFSPIINDTISYTATVTRSSDGVTGQCGIDFTVVPFPQCKDGKDNADPEDTLKDAQDPGCHMDGNPNNPSSYNPNDNDETDTVVIGCQLEITKTLIGDGEVVVGDQVHYRINVKNIGDRDCTGGGVKIVDRLDSGITYVSGSESHSSGITAGYLSSPLYTSSDRTLRWNANVLNPNEEGFVEFRATVGMPSACTTTISNKAKISADQYNNFQDWVESNTVNVTATKDCTPPPPPPPPQCPVIVEAPNGLYAISGATTVELDATDLGSEAGYVNSFGYYLADASRTPIKGSIIWANVKNPSTPHVTLTLSSADVVGASYIAFFIIPNGGSYDTFTNGQTITFANSGGWKVLVGSVYVPVRFGDPFLNGGTDYERDQPGVPGNSDWEDLNDNDYNDVQVQVSIRACNVPPPPPPPDVCSNIDGSQATVPGGYELVDGQCRLIPPSGPTCTLSISTTAPINSGDAIRVGWVSANATSGSINHNAGNATPVSGGSTSDLFPSSTTVYTGTFGNGVATTTCSATVTVGTGGGCNGSSCGGGGGGGGGGGLNQPTVVLYGQPGVQPLAFVSLAAVPYTGFEAGTLLTMLFWLAVALWSAGIAYVLMGRQGMRLIAEKVFSFAPAVGYDEGAYAETVTDVAEAPLPDQPSVMTSAIALPMTPAVMVTPMPASSIPTVTDGIPHLADVIETRAHAAGVLLSPEALTMAMALATDRAECLRIFGDILNDAVKSVPREDGWILLSSDRFADIVQRFSVHTPAPLRVASAEGASRIADAIIRGDRDAAFAAVHTAEVANADAALLIQEVAATLALKVVTGNASFEHAARVFSQALTASYTSKYTNLKLALAQAFEVR